MLGDAQRFGNARNLQHRTDANAISRLARVEAEDGDFPRIEPGQSEKQPDRGCFSRPVRSEQGEELAGAD